MCSEGGTEASSSYDASETTTESSVESSDSSTELYQNSESYETDESSTDLMEIDEQSNEELVENGDDSNKDLETNDKSDYGIVESSDDENEINDSSQIRAEIEEKSNYSDEVTEKISSVEELEVYQRANLKEENIDGRTCLIRDDIDMEYVDPNTGMTNQELMEKGRAPYDAKTGERIELHHVGQDYDSPLAELTEDTEHGDYYAALHTKEGESWRHDSQKNNYYNNVERPGHWKSRVKGG